MKNLTSKEEDIGSLTSSSIIGTIQNLQNPLNVGIVEFL